MIFLMLVTAATYAQEERLINVLKPAETAPENLLSSRSAVLFDNSYKQEELNRVQAAFQQIGIDADFYFDAEKVLSGIDNRTRLRNVLHNTRSEVSLIPHEEHRGLYLSRNRIQQHDAIRYRRTNRVESFRPAT